jgi:aminomethyltransferase
MVVNAGNRDKIFAWLQSSAKDWQKTRAQHDFTIVDNTLETAMVAVQGPKAFDVLNPFFRNDDPSLSNVLRSLKYYHLSGGRFDGCPVTVSRTGYTGEDGFEIFFPAERAAEFWQRIVAAAEAVGGMAAGLGARDTLRLEAAMPLYGHELSEAINPFQAGLSFAVNLGGRDFVGRAALEKLKADKTQPVRVGLQLDGKRVPRQGCAVLQGAEKVGEVTSGTFSPTFERPIAMAYVRPSAQAVGRQMAVDIRGTHHPAVVVPLPFYQREKKN